MIYLIILPVLLFIVALILKVPVYRAATWVLAATIALLAGAFIVTQHNQADMRPGVPPSQTQAELAVQAAKTEDAQWRLVAPDQAAILSGTLKPGDPQDPNHPMDYAATVKNSSDRDLDKVAVRIRLYDCPGKPPPNWEGCLATDEDTENIPTQLPAHGTRPIGARFRFHRLHKTIGTFAWQSEISRIRAADENRPQ